MTKSIPHPDDPVIAEPVADTTGAADGRTTQPLPGGRPLKRPTVLVVDDSPDAQDVLREYLESSGYDVLVAHNGRDALATLVEQATPILVVIDLLMPVMDGMELIEVLNSYRRLAQIPLLVVSGVDVPAASRVQRVRYLRKPVRRADFLASVSEILGAGPGL